MDEIMNKMTIIARGISKEEEKIVNSIQEFATTGEYEKIRPYNVATVDLELTEVGEHIDSAMQNVANELVKYYKRNGAKNIVIKNCWTSSDKVYNGVRNKEYFAGWIEIEFEKEIKSLNRMVANLENKADEIVEAENKKLEVVRIEKEKEEMEKITITKDISEEINSTMVTENITCEVKKYSNFVVCYRLDAEGKRMQYLEDDLKIKMHKDIYDRLVAEGVIVIENKVKFKPELTAIDTRNSESAEIVTEIATAETKVLDYGCGTGRNIKYIKNNTPAIVHGCDIPEQLEKEREKHSKLMDERTVIAPASELENENYDVVLNSHVLNVIESDEVKKIVVADIFQKLKEGGKAIIEVRTKQDVEGAKTKEKYGDGWKIKKGSSYTYQEGITKEKMINLVSSVGFKIEEHIYNSNKHIIQVIK